MRIIIEVIVAIFLVFIIFGIFSNYAKGHSFYDYDCCSDKDCAPVTLIQKKGDGDEFTTIHGTVFINNDSDVKRRKSQDDKFHVCMQEYYSYETDTKKLKPICIYTPALY